MLNYNKYNSWRAFVDFLFDNEDEKVVSKFKNIPILGLGYRNHTLFMTKTAEKPYPLGPHITIILRNRVEYRLMLRNQTIFRKDNCFIQQIDNKARNIFKSFCQHFFTSLFLLTYEATYITGYLLPTDDRYREHHDHIWTVLQFVE